MELSRLPKDPLVLILEELDPYSLCQFAQASLRVLTVIVAYKPLFYKLELALSGMKNGPPSNDLPYARLPQLSNYKRALPTLCWSQEKNHTIPTPALAGVSGGFFFYAYPVDFQFHLQVAELPCPRIGRSYPQHRGLGYPVPFVIQSITIDAAQELIVISEIFQGNSPISVRLHLRQLLVNAIHPRACAGTVPISLDWGDDPEHNVSVGQVEICGEIVGVSLCLHIGHEQINRLALVNWRTGRAILWTNEVLSFQFLDDSRIIVAYPPNEDDEDDDSDDHVLPADCRAPSCRPMDEVTPPILAIHNINNLMNSENAQLRVYQLPENWSNVVSIQIETNTSPTCDSQVRTGTYFYPDPNNRIFVLSGIFHRDWVNVGYAPRSMLVVRESLFKSPEHRPFDVTWKQWRRHCLLIDLSQAVHSLRVIGSRIFYAEWVRDSRRPHIPRSRVHLIDFNAYAVDCIRPNTKSSGPWTWTGRWTTATTIVDASRILPYIRTVTKDSYEVFQFYATDDNLVFLVESPNPPGAMIVKTLTFDKLPALHSSR